jgi:uncharacterized protein YecE (DUF72 family)
MRSWGEFVSIAKILRAKIVILQSPASFSESEENVRNILDFFSTVERDFIYGWEPRGKWSESTLRRIFEEASLIHVVDPFKTPRLHGEFGYYRLHGKTGYRYQFTEDDLLWLRNMVKDGDYVMFNNTNMWEDARRFKEIVASMYV